MSAGETDSSVNTEVHIAVRPEQAILSDDLDNADLQGTITNILYSGTDSHFHVQLTSEEEFVTKVQNAGPARRDWQHGQTVGIKFHPGSVQILRD